MVKRRVYDDEKHIHFVTFSRYRRRKFLEPDHAKRIVIGHLGSRLSTHDGLCLGFVIMPDHVHALMWFPETRQLSRFMNEWKGQSSHALKELFRTQFPNYLAETAETDPVWQAALSMIIPHLLVFAVELNPSAGLGSRSMGGANAGVDLTSKIVMLAGPVTFAIAFLCAAFSLMPDATKTAAGPPTTD